VKKLLFVTGAAVLVGVVLLGSRLWAQAQPRKLTDLEAYELFQRVVTDVQVQYYRRLQTPDLIKGAIDGMLSSLDPYSEYLEQEEATELQIRTQGEFGGIGIHIGTQEGQLSVMQVIEGTPAFRQGILTGDKFMEVEGKSAQGMTVRDAVNTLRGPPGTQVTVAMQREGVSDLIRRTIAREVIKIKAVPYAGKLGTDVGYVRLADFSASARQELGAALDSLVRRVGVRKLIFDLRLNGGGLLAEGHEVSELFLSPGDTIVTTAGQTPGSKRAFVAGNPSAYVNLPLVLLVDRASASAAEIVAGALQDHERAVIVGETTFGKGTVQSPIPMRDNARLKLTTALWRTPSGRCVDIRVKRDSLSRGDSIFYTRGRNHRLIRGWNGIVPDMVVQYPKMSEFELKIKPDWYFEFANKYVVKHPDLTPDFAVTPEMLAEFQALVKTKKLEFTPAQFDSARPVVERGLVQNIAIRNWGTAAEYERRLPKDNQVMRALELLASARIQQDLFDALPGTPAPKKQE
jgi:carboxyl-terminal processing protease